MRIKSRAWGSGTANSKYGISNSLDEFHLNPVASTGVSAEGCAKKWSTVSSDNESGNNALVENSSYCNATSIRIIG